MKKIIGFCCIILILLTGCGQNNKLWDSSIIQNIWHGGTFVGYASVYTIDWLNNTKTRSDRTYPVYKKNNGTYIIDYEGHNYVIYEAEEPYGSGVYSLKYQIDYRHYIEKIPTSF